MKQSAVYKLDTASYERKLLSEKKSQAGETTPNDNKVQPPSGKFKCKACVEGFMSKQLYTKHRKSAEHKNKQLIYDQQ